MPRTAAPEHDDSVDYFKLLGVTPDADTGAIRKAFLKLALKYHPDKNIGNEEAAKSAFQQIAIAHEVLKDSTKRQTYLYVWRNNFGPNKRPTYTAPKPTTTSTSTPKKPQPSNTYWYTNGSSSSGRTNTSWNQSSGRQGGREEPPRSAHDGYGTGKSTSKQNPRPGSRDKTSSSSSSKNTGPDPWSYRDSGSKSQKSGPSAYSSTNRREEARRPPSSGTGSSKQGNFGGFAWEKTSRPGAAPTSRRYEDDTNFPRGKTGSAGAGATPQGRHTKFGFDKDDKGWEKPAPKGAYTSSSRDKPIPKNVSGFSSSEEEEPKMPAFNKKKESFDPPPPHARTQGYYPSPEDEEDLYDEIRKRPVATPTSKVWPGAPSPGMKFPKTYTSPFASGTNTLNQPPPKQAPASAFTFQRSNTPEPKPMGAQASFSAPGGTGTGTGTYSFNFTGSGTTQPPPSWNAKASSTSTPSPSKHTKTHNPDRPSPYRPSGNSPKFTGPRFTGDIFGQAGMRPKEREASSHVKIPLFDFGFGAGVEGTEFNANQNGGKPRAKKGAKMGAGVDSPSTPAGGFTFSFKGGKKEGEGAEGEKTFKFDYEQWTRSFAESKKAEEAKANGQAETGTANGSRPTSSRSATGTPYEWQDDGFDEEMNDAPPMPPTEPPVPPEIPTMTPPTQIPTAPQTLNEGVFHTYLQSLLAYRLQWTEYTDQYTAYAASWHQFERLCNEEQLLFTSVADMFGKTSSEQEAARKMFEVYMEAAERNDRVREEWVEAERRHRRVLKEFNGVRLREVERVRAATEAAAAGQKSDATSAST